VRQVGGRQPGQPFQQHRRVAAELTAVDDPRHRDDIGYRVHDNRLGRHDRVAADSQHLAACAPA
jgi:hypothetical protein